MTQPPSLPEIRRITVRPCGRKHLTARVPEAVSRGVFSTGIIMMTGSTEFVIDFLQNLGQPAQVVARVAMPHGVLPNVIAALKTNLDNYKQRFGSPPELPRPPQSARRPSVQEIYDELKISDEVLAGAFANGLMVGHSASEFKLDFLTNLFPHSAVSCRVFVSAPQMPRIIESMHTTWRQFQERVQQQQRPLPPPADEPPSPPTDPDAETGS